MLYALLLQGPVGPFFNGLKKELKRSNFKVKHVIFNAGDKLYSNAMDTILFLQPIHLWENWLEHECLYHKPDFIVLFGCMRPAHVVARRVAKSFNIPIISLEEGYLRSGYITCEVGGNNFLSPLCHGTTSFEATIEEKQTPALSNIGGSFFNMCVWGFGYYFWRRFHKTDSEVSLYHREIGHIPVEIYCWMRYISRHLLMHLLDHKNISSIVSHHAYDYIFVPLQVPNDAQMLYAAKGWTNKILIKNILSCFHKKSNVGFIVFKIHPLDENARQIKHFIYKEAQALDIQDKIKVIECGKLNKLISHAKGMIVINSTSAMSALHYNLPILVLGEAIYRHPSLVTIGRGIEDIKDFLCRQEKKKYLDSQYFLNEVKNKALIPGNFYLLRKKKVTARNVIYKIKEVLSAHISAH